MSLALPCCNTNVVLVLGCFTFIKFCLHSFNFAFSNVIISKYSFGSGCNFL